MAFSIKDSVNELERRLRTKEDFKWRYSVDESRFYTYEELKGRRELDPFPNQKNFVRTAMDPEELFAFKRDVLDNPKTFQIDYDNPQMIIPEVLNEGRHPFYDPDGLDENDEPYFNKQVDLEFDFNTDESQAYTDDDKN